MGPSSWLGLGEGDTVWARAIKASCTISGWTSSTARLRRTSTPTCLSGADCDRDRQPATGRCVARHGRTRCACLVVGNPGQDRGVGHREFPPDNPSSPWARWLLAQRVYALNPNHASLRWNVTRLCSARPAYSRRKLPHTRMDSRRHPQSATESRAPTTTCSGEQSADRGHVLEPRRFIERGTSEPRAQTVWAWASHKPGYGSERPRANARLAVQNRCAVLLV